ncbi:MAG: Dyp-type peroxidase [Solirubrobacterales bacterium]
MPVADRGPRHSYRPDDPPPSVVGEHQPGIATPVLDFLELAGLDLGSCTRQELVSVLREISEEAETLMRAEHRARRPRGGLTVTVGFGASLFDERFGLESRRPAGLKSLPSFSGDALDPQRCDGDLCLQVCADNPDKAAAATERLLASVQGAAAVRWRQRAEMRRAQGEPPTARPRNLLGFKEATGNPRRALELDRHVWVVGRERTWMIGGTFLVVRQIRIKLDAWARLAFDQRERVIGRHRDSGALLGKSHEFEPFDPADEQVPADAHVRLASGRENGGARLLRRGYSYGGAEPAEAEGGMVLLFYQQDPRRQFVPIQARLAAGDALNAFSEPIGSGVFAVPPGAPEGGFIGEGLFA